MGKNHNPLVLVGLALFFILIFAVEVSAFSGVGNGSSGNPYQITNCTQLQEMKNNMNASYILKNEIDCSDTINWNSGAGFVPIGTHAFPFTGTFDGQGYKINGLFINRPSNNYIGLFGSAKGTKINNVGLVDANIIGYYYVGRLVGENIGSGTIINSYATGKVTGGLNYVGGLVGWNWGTISKSYSTGKVIGLLNYVGGLVGYNVHGIISNCYSTATVTGNSYLGGLTGENNQGTITNSYATGSITAASEGFNVGGLAGRNSDGMIRNSYATGGISGGSSIIGGLVGMEAFESAIINSYWYNSKTICCGYVYPYGGTCTGCTKASAKSNFYSQSHDVYDTKSPNWDFVNIWGINNGVSYPYFLDSDGDGINRNVDNCPDVPNSDQANSDVSWNQCESMPERYYSTVGPINLTCNNNGTIKEIVRADYVPYMSEISCPNGGEDSSWRYCNIADTCIGKNSCSFVVTNGNCGGDPINGTLKKLVLVVRCELPDDGMGDACDDDKEGDGIANNVDNCQNDYNPNQGNTIYASDNFDDNYLNLSAWQILSYDPAISFSEENGEVKISGITRLNSWNTLAYSSHPFNQDVETSVRARTPLIEEHSAFNFDLWKNRTEWGSGDVWAMYRIQQGTSVRSALGYLGIGWGCNDWTPVFGDEKDVFHTYTIRYEKSKKILNFFIDGIQLCRVENVDNIENFNFSVDGDIFTRKDVEIDFRIDDFIVKEIGNFDEDAYGDVCDICPFDKDDDDDKDGYCADKDNCPNEYNPNQANSDGDYYGDICDVCPLDPNNDNDKDGYCANVDNCPEIDNPDQSDADKDGLGDICDGDKYGDGIGFFEGFSNSSLSPEWQVIPMNGVNGVYSLTANPGYLFFNISGDNRSYSGGWRNNYTTYGNWTPSLTLIRPFDGENWTLKTNVNYNLRANWWNATWGTGAQGQGFWIALGEGVDNYVHIYRDVNRGVYGTNEFKMELVSNNSVVTNFIGTPYPIGYDSWIIENYWYEITKSGEEITVRFSEDGVHYITAFSGSLIEPVTLTQRVIIDNDIWMNAGSYVKWNYINFDIHGSTEICDGVDNDFDDLIDEEYTNCNDYLPCTTDTCSAGACSHDIINNKCLISGTCYARYALNPLNPCDKCRDDWGAYYEIHWGNLGGVDNDFDKVCSDVDNCLNVANPDQLDSDGDGVGDGCDICPDDITDTCNSDLSGNEYINASEGGMVDNSDGSVVIDIPQDALENSTTISITEVSPENANILLGVSKGVINEQFSFTPNGIIFNEPVTIKLKTECTSLCDSLKIWTYNSETGEWEGLATTCIQDGLIYTCTAETMHFSLFALIGASDSDSDGAAANWYGEVDCNDNNPNIYPGAEEICNNLDDNCDGVVDESCTYQWAGFFQPVENPPTLNQVKAGSAIPVKFSLGGDMGLNIFTSGYPVSGSIACDLTTPIDVIEETVSAGGSSLKYNSTTNQYTYVWKTTKSWTGCRKLIIILDDGTIHTANFKFTR